MLHFQRIFLPYCLEQLDDDRYLVLNRNHQPVGRMVEGDVRHDKDPVSIRFTDPGADLLQRLSVNASNDRARVFLYDDKSDPALSDENWQAYAERLRLLASATIEPVDRKGSAKSELVEVPGFPVFHAKRNRS